MPLPSKKQPAKKTPDAQLRHEDCWAKTTPSGQPGISVAQHCLTAGIIANLLLTQFPAWLAKHLCTRTGIVLAALHDIGKVCPGFQKKCPAWVQKHGLTDMTFLGMEEDHAKVSQKVLQDVLLSNGADDRLRFWSAIVGAHHGKLKGDRITPLGYKADGSEQWSAERRGLVEELIQEFGPLPGQPPPDSDCGALWFNAGLIAVADWLASDEDTFPPSKVLDAEAIRARAIKQLERIGFRSVMCQSGKTFDTLFPFPPNPLQALFANAVRQPGVYVVEASMGCGKTEASLIATYNLLASGQATGLYFALPTQVTSNRIHRRVQDFVEKFDHDAAPRLIHGNSWLLMGTPKNGLGVTGLPRLGGPCLLPLV